eukprot:GHUV01055292.1.p3 GENE.GHUV01055292.1~~GHUV01055292.1.p3  ORF type:complete len:114 (-),score=8.72 GHUV01055292.1:1390-1731(-)
MQSTHTCQTAGFVATLSLISLAWNILTSATQDIYVPVDALSFELIPVKLHHYNERHLDFLAGGLYPRQHPVHLDVMCELEDKLVHNNLDALSVLANWIDTASKSEVDSCSGYN